MNRYGAFCDDTYVNMHLTTEMDVPQSRESVLHFFEQIQKRFPKLSNFYARERSEFCLEEEKENGGHCWVAIEPRRISSSVVNPASFDEAMLQHCAVMELVPFSLSISHLDCESLNITMGFDFTYRGNQNELLAEALGLIPAHEKLLDLPGSHVLGYEPSIQLTLDEECRTQCRLAFETRNTAFQIRSGEFGEEQLSVYLVVRRYDSLKPGENYVDELKRLAGICRDIVDNQLIDNVLKPLQQTIALK
ncbi:MAG: hypothetical protein IT423_02545 [Pirellulaceae bacterium]|nr:hypothetical protein [Pirellulaceae bacterium]